MQNKDLKTYIVLIFNSYVQDLYYEPRVEFFCALINKNNSKRIRPHLIFLVDKEVVNNFITFTKKSGDSLNFFPHIPNHFKAFDNFLSEIDAEELVSFPIGNSQVILKQKRSMFNMLKGRKRGHGGKRGRRRFRVLKTKRFAFSVSLSWFYYPAIWKYFSEEHYCFPIENDLSDLELLLLQSYKSYNNFFSEQPFLLRSIFLGESYVHGVFKAYEFVIEFLRVKQQIKYKKQFILDVFYSSLNGFNDFEVIQMFSFYSHKFFNKNLRRVAPRHVLRAVEQKKMKFERYWYYKSFHKDCKGFYKTKREHLIYRLLNSLIFINEIVKYFFFLFKKDYPSYMARHDNTEINNFRVAHTRGLGLCDSFLYYVPQHMYQSFFFEDDEVIDYWDGVVPWDDFSVFFLTFLADRDEDLPENMEDPEFDESFEELDYPFKDDRGYPKLMTPKVKSFSRFQYTVEIEEHRRFSRIMYQYLGYTGPERFRRKLYVNLNYV